MTENCLNLNTPIQMISCTDTNGKITPMRFRFKDGSGSLITVNVEKILSHDQDTNRMAANFTCLSTIYGTQKMFCLRYSYQSHSWKLFKVQV
jgi:hypothetical protein